MELFDALKGRRSIRKFIDKPIEKEKIRMILEAGTLAPSGGNRQPWRFIVVTDKEKIKLFDPYAHQECVENAPAVIVVCADPHDTWAKYDEDDPCYRLDTSAAIQNMLLAIHGIGLGAVWVITCSKRDIRKLVEIPKHWEIISIISFGYYNDADNPNRAGRRPLSEVAFMEDIGHPVE